MKLSAKKAQEKQKDQTWLNQITLSTPSSSLHINYIEDAKIFCQMVFVYLFIEFFV